MSHTFNRAYGDPQGVWQVSTNQDIYGKAKDLGTYEGYIDEIAFALADKAIGCLRFKKRQIDPIPLPSVAKDTVNISFDKDSGTRDLNSAQRVIVFQTILKNRDVTVDECQFNGSVCLRSHNSIELKRQIALSKLTDEEKEILGLMPSKIAKDKR